MNLKLNNEQIAYINGLDAPEAKQEFLLNCFLQQCELAIAIEKDNLHKENYGSDRLIATALSIMANKRKSNIEYIDPDEPKEGSRIDLDGSSTTTTFLSREKFDKFIEDNGLKKFTPPESSNESNSRFIPIAEYLSKEEIDQIRQSNSNIDNYLVDTKSCTPEFLSKEQLKGKHLWIINGTEFKFTDSSSIVTKASDKPVYFGTINMKQYEYLANHRYAKEDLQSAFEASRQDIMGIPLFNNFEEYLKAITPNI